MPAASARILDSRRVSRGGWPELRRAAGLVLAIAMTGAGCGLGPDGDAGEEPDGPALIGPGNPEDDVTPRVNLAGPTGLWAWFDIPGTRCGNGSQTGIGVNIGTGTDLLIYLEGGGACWDELTCSVGIDGLGLASYIHSGYGREQFDAATPRAGIFDRELPDNPFRDATMIYVPYCTGDLHAGSATQRHPIAQRTMHFAGRQNLEADLAQIVASFPEPSRVTLAGSSAGGWGSTFNYGRVAEAFGDVRVDLVADSSPMFARYGLLLLGWRAWGLSSALPPDCASCADDFRAVLPHYASAYPGSPWLVAERTQAQQAMAELHAMAAEGDADAQLQLSRAYATGLASKPDLVAAYVWAARAAGGASAAPETRAGATEAQMELARRMKPDDIAYARRFTDSAGQAREGEPLRLAPGAGATVILASASSAR